MTRTTPTVLEAFFEFAICRRVDCMLSLYWTTEQIGKTVTLRAEDNTGVVVIEKADDGGFTVTFYLRKKAKACLWMYERFLEKPYHIANCFVDDLIDSLNERLNSMKQQ